MKDYIGRFGAILGCMVGVVGGLAGIGWLMYAISEAFGFIAVIAFIIIIAAATTAAMPKGGPPLL
ncbi:hypothetical protein [Noviluteimonas dokdonensis]|uniref:hypothetical protein n=1 Tax=Noviluteimonas dokdonensis TaxID=414050 RepID=UPI00056419D9|nr:hypothetical protein [Lysobacter dokdonensis]